MNLVYVGKIVNTHGLKGEVRILSTFSLKQEIFKKGFLLYIDNKTYTVNSYRKHKNFDMVIFKEFNDINEVLFLKGKDVYINRADLDENIILDTDLIGMKVISDKGIRGEVISISEGVNYNYLEVLKDNKSYYIPNIDAFIREVNKELKEIKIEEIEGLLDEN